jgi:hypothetical protein
MKKLLGIVVLGLLLSGNAFADLYSNCYFDKISDPRLKSFERKSFKEMTNFPNYQDLIKNKFKQIAKVPLPAENIKKFTNLEFEIIFSLYSKNKGLLKYSFVKNDGNVGIDYFKFKLTPSTDNLEKYYPISDGGYKKLFLIKSKKEIQIQTIYQKWNNYKLSKYNSEVFTPGWDDLKDEKITFFLKCEKYKKGSFNPNEPLIKKKKSFDFENYFLLAIIIIGLLNLIVLSLLLWRTFRKNK